jgi:hypothetical protein
VAVIRHSVQAMSKTEHAFIAVCENLYTQPPCIVMASKPDRELLKVIRKSYSLTDQCTYTLSKNSQLRVTGQGHGGMHPTRSLTSL